MVTVELFDIAREVRLYRSERSRYDLDFICPGPSTPRELITDEQFTPAQLAQSKERAKRYREKLEKLLALYGIKKVSHFDTALGDLLQRYGVVDPIKRFGETLTRYSRRIDIDTKVSDDQTQNLTDVNRPLEVEIRARGGLTAYESPVIDLIVPELKWRDERGYLRFFKDGSLIVQLWGYAQLERGPADVVFIRDATPTDIRQFGQIIDMVATQIVYQEDNSDNPSSGRRASYRFYVSGLGYMNY